MTKKEAIDVLNNLNEAGDTEDSHMVADDVLCAALRNLGHADLADAWERARDRCGFWYA